MDFELIDELSDEDIVNLYNDYTTQSLDDKISKCHCYNGAREIIFGGTFMGGCSMMQEEGLYTKSACRDWCINQHGFEWYMFYICCYCGINGDHCGVQGTHGYMQKCVESEFQNI